MKRILTFAFVGAAQLFAQQPQVATEPVPVPAPRAPFIVPAEPQPVPNPGVQGVSASFEAGARVGRPVKFRITLIGVRQVLEFPQVPEVAGLSFQNAGRTMQGDGISTFLYDVFPSHPGAFVVPSFEFMAGGRKIVVPQTSLEVAEARPGEPRYQPVISYIEIPKRDFYVGETIAGRIVFAETPDETPRYIQHVAKTGGAAVFKVENMFRSIEVEIEGTKHRAIAKPVQITPLKEGPGEVSCQVLVHVEKKDPSASFAMQTQSSIDVPPTRFRVLPLPKEGRLPGFTGAIGVFTLSKPKISATEVEMGEPITMAISLTGEGNLIGVSAPDVPAENSDWQIFKPTTDIDSPGEESAPLMATKTFTFTLIAKRANVRATPALPFSYFDPAKAAFVDVSIPPQAVKVKAAPEMAAGVGTRVEERPPEAPEAKAAKPAEPALTGLAESPGRWTRSLRPALWSRWFLGMQALPALFLIGLWGWRKRNEYLVANPQILRRRRARAAARIALNEARAAAQSGDQPVFLAASTRAIREAAAPLDTAQAGSLTQEEVLFILREDAVATRTAKSIFESAEAQRYGVGELLNPGKLIPDLEHTLARLCAKA